MCRTWCTKLGRLRGDGRDGGRGRERNPHRDPLSYRRLEARRPAGSGADQHCGLRGGVRRAFAQRCAPGWRRWRITLRSSALRAGAGRGHYNKVDAETGQERCKWRARPFAPGGLAKRTVLNRAAKYGSLLQPCGLGAYGQDILFGSSAQTIRQYFAMEATR